MALISCDVIKGDVILGGVPTEIFVVPSDAIVLEKETILIDIYPDTSRFICNYRFRNDSEDIVMLTFALPVRSQHIIPRYEDTNPQSNLTLNDFECKVDKKLISTIYTLHPPSKIFLDDIKTFEKLDGLDYTYKLSKKNYNYPITAWISWQVEILGNSAIDINIYYFVYNNRQGFSDRWINYFRHQYNNKLYLEAESKIVANFNFTPIIYPCDGDHLSLTPFKCGYGDQSIIWKFKINSKKENVRISFRPVHKPYPGDLFEGSVLQDYPFDGLVHPNDPCELLDQAKYIYEYDDAVKLFKNSKVGEAQKIFQEIAESSDIEYIKYWSTHYIERCKNELNR